MKNPLTTLRRNALLQIIALCVLLPSFVMLPNSVRANPQGGVVVAGAAEILQGEDFDPAFLEILQSSDKAIINWESFSIGEGETTRFNVPGITSATLNRVMSGDPSAIYGNLISNGKLIVINQNGILVGPGGRIDAFGGFTGSTLDISDADFMGGGDDIFAGSSAAGITNFGTIVSGGGDVILLGNFIDNQGTIGAVDGTIALGAGGDILVSQAGEAKISIRAAGPGGNVGINNTGDIRGSSVELKAHGNVYAQAINNSGMIRATGATTDSNGRVMLSARSADGTGGSIVNTGEIRANNADGSGGAILVDAGGADGIADIDGVVKANGFNDTPGGVITILGETINFGPNADVGANGSEGGAIIIGSADETTGVRAAAGSKITANGSVGNGGTVIISGNNDSVISLDGTVEARGAETGGLVSVTGGSVSVGNTGMIDASGGIDGGFVNIDAVNGVATINGTVLADGGSGNGGFVSVKGSDGVSVGPNALISASGEINGGTILMESSEGAVNIDGTINANGVTGNGGVINVQGAEGATLGAGGSINANGGQNGGAVTIDGGNGVTALNGTVNANGVNGAGGQITVSANGGVSVGNTANVNANGGTSGGVINVDSAGDTIVDGGAQFNANGITGAGGRITVTGQDVVLRAGPTNFSANGGAGGGELAIGGSFQGTTDSSIRNSLSTQVGNGITLSADSTGSGNAGRVVAWSDGDTYFAGDVLARGLGEVGNGGIVEISGKRDLRYRGSIDATSLNGDNGMVLFDPGDVIIGNGTGTDTLAKADINNLLQAGTSVIIATDNSDSGNGSITVRSTGDNVDDRDMAIQWNTSADIGLFAAGNITLLSSVRNAGSGSVNIIAGWDGLEADLPGFTFVDNGVTPGPGDFTGSAQVEDIYDFYVAGDQYGSRGGTVFMNDVTNNAFVHVGSRFGRTNVAAQNLIMQSGPDSRRNTHLGFYDSGNVFDTTGVQFGTSRALLVATGDALVAGIDGPVVTQGGQEGVNLYFYDDVPTTGYSSNPVTDGALLTDGFVAFNDHWHRADIGNYWWQRLTDTTDGLGDLAPESGAGKAAGSATGQADIKVDLKGSLIMNTDNEDGDVQIGHGARGSQGGDGRNWGSNRGDGDQAAASDFFSTNMAHDSNRWASGIARRAPIYSDITITAGGLVDMKGTTSRFVQIGHLGNVQVGGEVQGNITVSAGADISLAAGGGWGGHATIGHHLSDGETFVDPTDQAATAAWHFDAAGFNNEENNVQRGNDVYTNLKGDIAVTSTFGTVKLRAATAGAGSGSGQGNTADPIIPFGTDANADANLADGVGIHYTQNGFGRGGRGSAQIGHGGNDVGAYSRANLIGNITVLAGVSGTDPDNLTVNNASAMVDIEAGTRLYAYALIGHGGNNASNQVNSDYMAGDVRVQAAGGVRVSGSTVQPTYPLTNFETNANRGNPFNEDLRAFAQIGHGGVEADNQFQQGDILVTTETGDVTITAAPWRRSYSMIGHGGAQVRGQTGGGYTRTHDGITFTDAGTTGGAAVFQTGGELTLTDKDGNAFGALLTSVPGGDTTADIKVVSRAGGVTLNHLDWNDGLFERSINNPSIQDDPTDNDPTDGIFMLRSGRFLQDQSFSMIGHGGRDTGFNTATGDIAFDDKFGNIEVSAFTDIVLENGSTNESSTHIGHTDQIERYSGGDDDAGNPRRMFLNGDITVTSETGSILLDAAHADAFLKQDSQDLASPLNDIPISRNPVRIGHGGVWNNRRVAANGNITVTAAQDVTLLGGAAQFASAAQIGHGMADPEGNEPNEDDTFIGNIKVDAGGDITLTANPNSFVLDPTNAPNAFDIEGAAAFIGHGGVGVDGGASGNIDVTAQGNLTMTSTQRTQADNDTGTGPAASLLGFTAIGHVSPREEGTIQGSYTGDITVQVGGDLTMRGGTTPGSNDITAGTGSTGIQPVALAFSKIGHGGPDADGAKSGTIDITVGGNFSALGGSSPETDGKIDGLNYVQVGHGDWDRVSFSLPSSGQLASGSGTREGDIFVKVGETGTLSQALIGHADINILPGLASIGTGNTYFGVSRNNPFQSTGTGQLIAQNETVFSSAFYGFGSQLRLYVPKRELNLMEQGTQLNFTKYASGTPGETADGSGGVSFAPTFVLNGEQSGRADELYLNPDLWLQASSEGGVDFVPGDATMQGSVAAVSPNGDIGNLTGVTDNGQIGSGTGTYVGGSGLVNGITNYTIYYDAIGVFVPTEVAPVAPVVPSAPSGGGGIVLAPVIPFIPTPEEPIIIIVPFNPFDFTPFVDLFAYEASDRAAEELNDLIEGDAADSGGDTGATDDETEDEEEKKKKARYARQVDNWNTYYQYDLSTGKYNSLRLFGQPGPLSAE